MCLRLVSRLYDVCEGPVRLKVVVRPSAARIGDRPCARVRGAYEGCRSVLDVHGVEVYPDIMVVGRHLGGHKRVGLLSSRGSGGEGWIRPRHSDRDHALHVRDVEGADPVAWPPETRVSGCGCDGIEGRVGRAVHRLPETG